jgi:hypothetical protein
MAKTSIFNELSFQDQDKLLNDFNVNVHIPVYPLGGHEEVKITKDQYEYYRKTNV